MPVTVKGSGGGGVTLDAGAAASDTTLTLPNVSGTILQSGTAVTVAQGGTGATTLTANNVLLGNGTSAVQVVAPGTNGNVLTSNGTTWTSSAPAGGGLPTPSAIGQIPFSTDGSTYAATQKIVQGTAVASTSGTSIDFTSIPSWVKRVTVMLNGVSVSGTSSILIQFGTSGGIDTSGYTSSSFIRNTTGQNSASYTTGFGVYSDNASFAAFGSVTISSMGSNLWSESHSLGGTGFTGQTIVGGGTKTLSSTLTTVRITTVNGTDTFDAGSINLLWE